MKKVQKKDAERKRKLCDEEVAAAAALESSKNKGGGGAVSVNINVSGSFNNAISSGLSSSRIEKRSRPASTDGASTGGSISFGSDNDNV